MRTRTLRLFAAASILAALGITGASSAQNPPGQTPGADSSHLQEMESEMLNIRAESEQLGGEPTPGASLNNVRTRINEIDGNIERLGDAMEKIGASTDELDRIRREYGDTGIVTLRDVAEEGAEQGIEYCVKRACTRYGAKAAGRAAGWFALLGDVVEYGGKLVIREINESRLRDAVRTGRVQHSELFEMLMGQYCERRAEREKVRRLEELRDRERALAEQIAEERQRLAERAGPATRHAQTGRDQDPAGDEEEKRQYLRDAVRPAGAAPAPRPQGVWSAEPTQGAMNLSPLANEVLAAHNAERARYGAPPLKWSPALEATATAYANQLARTGQRVHAARAGRGIERENLSQGLLGWNTNQMMGSWLSERSNFTPGTFPNVSRTGNWFEVGHYSQMIWPTTTSIGCGMAQGSGFNWLVCRYSPGGNKDSHIVGVPPTRLAATEPC